MPHVIIPKATRIDTQVAEHPIDTEATGGEAISVVILSSKRKAESDVPSSPTDPACPNNAALEHTPDIFMHMEERALSPLSELTESDSEAQAVDITTPIDIDNMTPINRSGRPVRVASNLPRLMGLAMDMNKYEGRR